MLLKIYLGISIITLICSVLANLSILNRAINKYGEQIEASAKKVKKKDRAGMILAWLKIVVASFLPVINVIVLLAIIFAVDKIAKQSDEYIEAALKDANKEVNQK